MLTVTQMLRAFGVANKFVEFYGDGLNYLPLADRATIANMAPEYGATCGIFPVDGESLNYLRLSGRTEEQIRLVEAYAKAQGLWPSDQEAEYSATLHLDMGTVLPSLAGPKRPQDRVLLSDMKHNYTTNLLDFVANVSAGPERLVALFGPEALFGIVLVFVLVFGSLSEGLGFHFVIGAFFGALLLVGVVTTLVTPMAFNAVVSLAQRDRYRETGSM